MADQDAYILNYGQHDNSRKHLKYYHSVGNAITYTMEGPGDFNTTNPLFDQARVH